MNQLEHGEEEKLADAEIQNIIDLQIYLTVCSCDSRTLTAHSRGAAVCGFCVSACGAHHLGALALKLKSQKGKNRKLSTQPPAANWYVQATYNLQESQNQMR